MAWLIEEGTLQLDGPESKKGTHTCTNLGAAHNSETHTLHIRTQMHLSKRFGCLFGVAYYAYWFIFYGFPVFSRIFWFLLTRICKLVPERKLSFSAGTFLDITYTHKRTHTR